MNQRLIAQVRRNIHSNDLIQMFQPKIFLLLIIFVVDSTGVCLMFSKVEEERLGCHAGFEISQSDTGETYCSCCFTGDHIMEDRTKNEVRITLHKKVTKRLV